MDTLIRKSLRSLRNILYRGHIKTAMRKLGLHRYARRGYFQLLDTVESRIEEDLPETKEKVSISGTDAEFRVTTKAEHDFLAAGEVPESEIIKDLLDELTPEDTFFDIGAHIGLFTCIVGSQYEQLDTVAIEPHPRTIPRLEENIELNGIDSTVLQCGISGSSGERGFDLRRNNIYGMGVIEDDASNTISVRSIDSIVSDGNLSEPTIIKSDIAGEEINLLRGGQTAFSEHIRVAYIEMHLPEIEDKDGTEEEIFELLREYGFTRFERFGGDGGRAYTLKCVKE